MNIQSNINKVILNIGTVVISSVSNRTIKVVSLRVIYTLTKLLLQHEKPITLKS